MRYLHCTIIFLIMNSHFDLYYLYSNIKIRASYFNVCALERVLDIHIDEIRTYTTYERTNFWDANRSEDPKIMVAPLGKRMEPVPEKEWENNVISVDVGEIMQFRHVAIKMQRTKEDNLLIGNLHIC